MPDEDVRLASADDEIVAGRAIDGDVDAFAVLVRRYTPMMRAHAMRILGSRDEAEDVVQDAFVIAWRQLGDLDRPAAVKSWLMRVTGRKALDRLRARRPQVELDDETVPVPESRTPARVVETRSQLAALAAALDELPEAQRQCWVLREVSGLSYDEIAEALGAPASTVRGLLARARGTLLARMEEWR